MNQYAGHFVPTDPEYLPTSPGLYRLWFDLDADVRVRIGALGEADFPAGRYGYTGSAMRGIRARVSRHLHGEGPRRWHIDYLLPHARIVHVEAWPNATITECALNAESLQTPEAAYVLRGFGSSDCRCCSHLVRIPAWMPVPLRAEVRLSSGEIASVRLLRADDAARLGAYFLALSDRTKSRYGPHPFDQPTADAICASLDPRDMFRVVATVGSGPDEQIIAYLLVKLGVRESDGHRYAALGIRLEPSECAALAPSVADAWQNRGTGSAIMPHLLAMVRSVGVRRMVLWDGVIADNHLAQGFYRKWGFVKVGEFATSVLNYDMIAEIGEAAPPNAADLGSETQPPG
jgi:Uri superfamily endonuclease/GNAT superfamily N-acetyltransferase